jgi:hypothetical protein
VLRHVGRFACGSFQDCVYFDRSCWPAYLQVQLENTEKLALPGIRYDVPSFSSYLSRYDVPQSPSSPHIIVSNDESTIKRDERTYLPIVSKIRVPKRHPRTSAASSVVNSFVSSEILPSNFSPSSSVSFDNPSVDDSELPDENQSINGKPIRADLTTEEDDTLPLSSSLSELDPMFNARERTPSPLPITTMETPLLTERP